MRYISDRYRNKTEQKLNTNRQTNTPKSGVTITCALMNLQPSSRKSDDTTLNASEVARQNDSRDFLSAFPGGSRKKRTNA